MCPTCFQHVFSMFSLLPSRCILHSFFYAPSCQIQEPDSRWCHKNLGAAPQDCTNCTPLANQDHHDIRVLTQDLTSWAHWVHHECFAIDKSIANQRCLSRFTQYLCVWTEKAYQQSGKVAQVLPKWPCCVAGAKPWKASVHRSVESVRRHGGHKHLVTPGFWLEQTDLISDQNWNQLQSQEMMKNEDWRSTYINTSEEYVNMSTCQHVNMNQHHQLHQNRKTSPAKWIECCDSYDSHDSYDSVWLSASKPWAPILRLGPQIAAARACTICIATRHVGDGASFYFLFKSTGTAFRSF